MGVILDRLSVRAAARARHASRPLSCFAAVVVAALCATAPTVSPAASRPKALDRVGFDQRLGERLPLDIHFLDSTGAEVRFRNLFGGKPLVLSFAYFRCPMLCPVALSSLVRTMKALSWSAGKEFRTVTVSVDPEDGPAEAAAQKRAHLDHYGREGSEWSFLTGQEPEIRAIADAVGFRYARDEESGEYAHPAGLVVVSSDGRISRYLFGVEIPPRDLRLALVEASEGKIGGFTDQLLLMCFHWDPTTGRYGAIALGAVRVAGALTLLGLGGLLVTLWHRERYGTHPS